MAWWRLNPGNTALPTLGLQEGEQVGVSAVTIRSVTMVRGTLVPSLLSYDWPYPLVSSPIQRERGMRSHDSWACEGCVAGAGPCLPWRVYSKSVALLSAARSSEREVIASLGKIR